MALWLVLVLLIALAAFTAGQRHPGWLRTWQVRLSEFLPGKAKPSGVQQARQASFITIEQLRGLGAGSAGRVYKVEGRLLAYNLEPNRDVRLVLGSLVNPQVKLEARLLPEAAAANQEDAALYAELRQDLGLRFGTPRIQAAAVPGNPEVIVTGTAVMGHNGVNLAPVLDIRVQ